jgi:hypothetical protein
MPSGGSKVNALLEYIYKITGDAGEYKDLWRNRIL